MGRLSRAEERYHKIVANNGQTISEETLASMQETAGKSRRILGIGFKNKSYGVEYRNYFPKSIAKVFVEGEKEWMAPNSQKIHALQKRDNYTKEDIKRLNKKYPKMVSGKWIYLLKGIIERNVESYNEIRNDLSIFAPNFLSILIEKDMLPANDVELDTNNNNNNSSEAINDNDSGELESVA